MHSIKRRSLCRQTRWTAECVSWNVSLRRQRRRWPAPTPTVGSCRGSWTMLLSRRTPWTEKSALWKAGWGADFFLHFIWEFTTFTVIASVQHSCLTLFFFFLFSSPFTGVIRLSACVRWLALAWTVMMRWPCRLKLLSLQQNKCWEKGKLSPQMGCKHINAWEWSYSLTALFSYAFIFGQIPIFITVTYIFLQKLSFQMFVCKVAVSSKISVFTFDWRLMCCYCTSLEGKTLSACFAHVFSLWGVSTPLSCVQLMLVSQASVVPLTCNLYCLFYLKHFCTVLKRNCSVHQGASFKTQQCCWKCFVPCRSVYISFSRSHLWWWALFLHFVALSCRENSTGTLASEYFME